MAVFTRNHLFLLTILLIAFCNLDNISEAEAAAATLLSKKSIDPPFGNSLIRTVDAFGVQIYKCAKNSSATGLQYTSAGAMATLYSPDGTSAYGKHTLVGYHYFLREPLAQGNVLAMKMLGSEDVDDLLLKAVSHSAQGNSGVSYVQRLHSKGGVPPSSKCNVVGKQLQIPYTAQYLFWLQDRSLPMGIPVEISVSKYFSPLLRFYAEGIQYYRFNGSSWINFNVSAYLHTSPGQEVVGKHYFSTNPDPNGGQPTWELFMPLSRVTVKVVSSITVDSDSIDWTQFEATSHGGSK